MPYNTIKSVFNIMRGYFMGEVAKRFSVTRFITIMAKYVLKRAGAIYEWEITAFAYVLT